MRRGLVFGKFMPLHRGHQLLIERALCEVDDLAIVVYDSAPAGRYPPMPLGKRPVDSVPTSATFVISDA